MSKKICVWLLATFLLATAFFAEAQQPEKVPRIGYLADAGSSPPQAFLQALRDLGYVEGKNIAFEYRSTEGKSERRPDQVADANVNAPHSAAQWFNTAAFQDVPSNELRPGNARRASILGPSSHRENVALLKNFRLHESLALQFRAEAFNVFNNVNFQLYTSNGSTGLDRYQADQTFGQIFNAAAPRILQLALKVTSIII